MWAREHHCPWDSLTCSAEGGHQADSVWAREHDCPWSEETFSADVFGSSLRASCDVAVGAGAPLPVKLQDDCKGR